MLMADVTRPRAVKPGLRPRGGGTRKGPPARGRR
jgi:hypothetical protein